jgi:sporulation protein YlmC with PRC-barrel domain
MKSSKTPGHKPAVISSEDVEGASIYDRLGKKIGKIDHLIIERLSGRVVSVVISGTGFLGLGHSHVELPWAALTYKHNLKGYEALLELVPS